MEKISLRDKHWNIKNHCSSAIHSNKYFGFEIWSSSENIGGQKVEKHKLLFLGIFFLFLLFKDAVLCVSEI